jgi:hypothetical protein
LEEREQGSECAAQEDDVVAIVDGTRKGVLVCIEAVEDLSKGRVGASFGRFVVPVEFEELRVEG